jgi:hypothetical protein
MPQIIEVPGHGEVEFPDDMSDEQIATAIKRTLSPARGATGDWGRGASGSWDDPRLSGKSNLEKYRMGGKVAFDGLKLGIKQLMGKATATDVDTHRAQTSGLMEDPVVRSGNVSGHVMSSLPLMLAPGGGSIVGSALYGGAYGAAQPVGTGESRVDNTIRAGVTSGGVTAGFKAVSRVAQPVKNSLNPDEQQAVDLLRRNGVRMTVAQQTGSKTAQGVQRALSDNPYTGPSMGAQAEKSARSLTRAFLRTAGVNADSVTPAVAGVAERRIGAGIDSINSRYALNLNQSKTLTDLTDLADEAKRILPDDGKRIVGQIDRMLNKASANGGRLEAATAQKIRQELGTLTRDQQVGEYAYRLREILDDALEAVATPADAKKLTELRSQYRNLQALIDSADTTVNSQVTGPRLAQTLSHSKYTRNSMRKGQGDTRLAELARAASTVADRFPNSGTAARAGAQLVAPSLVAGASYMQDQDPGRALQLALATYGLPKAAAATLNNPLAANYLARGLPVPPVANQLGQYALRIAPPVATSLVVGQ